MRRLRPRGADSRPRKRNRTLKYDLCIWYFICLHTYNHDRQQRWRNRSTTDSMFFGSLMLTLLIVSDTIPLLISTSAGFINKAIKFSVLIVSSFSGSIRQRLFFCNTLITFRASLSLKTAFFFLRILSSVSAIFFGHFLIHTLLNSSGP